MKAETRGKCYAVSIGDEVTYFYSVRNAIDHCTKSGFCVISATYDDRLELATLADRQRTANIHEIQIA